MKRLTRWRTCTNDRCTRSTRTIRTATSERDDARARARARARRSRRVRRLRRVRARSTDTTRRDAVTSPRAFPNRARVITYPTSPLPARQSRLLPSPESLDRPSCMMSTRRTTRAHTSTRRTIETRATVREATVKSSARASRRRLARSVERTRAATATGDRARKVGTGRVTTRRAVRAW